MTCLCPWTKPSYFIWLSVTVWVYFLSQSLQNNSYRHEPITSRCKPVQISFPHWLVLRTTRICSWTESYYFSSPSVAVCVYSLSQGREQFVRSWIHHGVYAYLVPMQTWLSRPCTYCAVVQFQLTVFCEDEWNNIPTLWSVQGKIYFYNDFISLL